MKGKVVEARELILPIVVIDGDGRPWEIDCVVDTGFTGALTLPPDAIQAIGLQIAGREWADLAGHRAIECSLYEAIILWQGRSRKIDVIELDDNPLVGMALLEGHRLAANVIDGGDVDISPLAADD